MCNGKPIFIILPLLFSMLLVSAQHRIAGTIKDATTGDPIAGAHIYLDGTVYATASDKEGKYEFTNVSNGNYLIRISHPGYQSEQELLEIYQNKSSTHFRLQKTGLDKNEFVYTPTRKYQLYNSNPVVTQIIKKADIESQSAFDLQQILTLNNPSFESFNQEGNQTFHFEGLGAKHLLVLVDGDRIPGGLDGNTTLSRINPATIERIEILNGAGSVLYGSNAVSGVINVITKDVSKPNEVVGGIQSGMFKNPASGNNSSKEYAYANVNLTRGKFSSFTSGKFNSYSPYNLNPEMAQNGFLSQEDEGNYSVYQKFSLALNDQIAFNAYGSYFSMDKNYQNTSQPDQKNENLAYSFKTIYSPFEKARFELSYRTDQNKMYDVLNLGTEKKDTLAFENLYQNIRLLGNIQIGYFNFITFGAEYIREKQSSLHNNFEENRQSYAVYIQDQLILNKDFSLLAGARNEFHPVYGSVFSPQLGALFSPGKFTFRWNYGRGFRAPSFKELYTSELELPNTMSTVTFYQYGNPNLKPETSEYISGSVQYSSEKLDVSVTYAINQIQSVIKDDSLTNVVFDLNTVPPAIEQMDLAFYNHDEVQIRSLNLMAQYQIFKDLSLQVHGSYLDAFNRTDDADLTDIRKLGARINLDFSHSFNKYAVSANLNYSCFGSKKTADASGSAIELPGYSLWRLMTSHTLKNRYTLKAGINNLFNKTDDQPEYANLSSPGRMLVIGASVNF